MADEKPQPKTLEEFACSLIRDLEELRAGKITIRQAKARAEIAREILRAFHLHIQGLRYLSGQAKPLPAPSPKRGAAL